jgi:hypothetical protein
MIEIYVIKTPNDTERWSKNVQEMKSQAINGSLEWNGFDAIMNSVSPLKGISQSHKGIVARAKERGLAEVCIIEDDVNFLKSSSLERFFNINKIIPKDCDLFFSGIYDGILGKEFSGYSEVTGQVSGLHCYIVKQKFYDELLAADENYNLDYFLSVMLKPKMYCANPLLTLQHNGYSYNTGKEQNYNYNIEAKYKLYGGE